VAFSVDGVMTGIGVLAHSDAVARVASVPVRTDATGAVAIF
jgi:hypothetical protein